MKYRILGMVAMVGMLLAVLLATALGQEETVLRVHQHLTARGPDAGCDCDGTELCTHLPLLIIDTGGQEIPGEPVLDEKGERLGYSTTADGSTEIWAKLSVIDGEETNHHPSDEPTMESDLLIHIRGNSSRYFDKKNYRLKLRTAAGSETPNDLSLLGMAPENDWALHGPFLDKTLVRNYMWMNISAEVMGYAPDVRFCEVILDGDCIGVYLLMETIKEDEYRVDLSDYQEGADRTSYLLLLDQAEEAAFLNNYTQYTYKTEFSVPYDNPTVVSEYSAYQVLYPQVEFQTPEVMDYIQRDISRVERGLYSSDMVAGIYDYASELDVDSFVDYYILQEFLLNNDAFTHSTYLYRDVRGKLTIGPVWDYNNMLNNYIVSFASDGLYLANRGWYGELMKDEAFVERVLDRYAQLRQGCLSDEYLLNYIDQTIAYLGPAIARNDQVWGYSYDPEQLDNYQRRRPDPGQSLESVNPGSYQEAVDWMKSFLLERGAWLDENLVSLRQYCHLSRNAAEWME